MKNYKKIFNIKKKDVFLYIILILCILLIIIIQMIIVYKRKCIRESFYNNIEDTFKDYSNLFYDKIGLEIGGPSTYIINTGVYTKSKSLDNANYSTDTIWSQHVDNTDYVFDGKTVPGKTFIADSVDLKIFQNKSYDFVVACHVLEHLVNPLKALKEMTRIIKDDGILFLILPYKEKTFDHKRPISNFSKLVDNYNKDRNEIDVDDYFPEIFELHDLSMDLPAGSLDNFKERSKKNYENRGLHVHVFDFDLIIQCLSFFNYEIIEKVLVHPYHQVVIGKIGKH